MAKIEPQKRTKIQRTRIIRGKRRKHSPGPPEYAPTEEQKRYVAEMVAHGAPKDHIARSIINPDTGEGVTPDTLEKHFSYELANGRVLANVAVSAALFKKAVGQPAILESRKVTKGNKTVEETVLLHKPVDPDTSAIRWWEATRAGKKEGMTMQLTGPDGQPLEVTHRHVFVLPSNGRELQDVTNSAKHVAITHAKR